jgi:hydroxyethylthiazole kinase-like uncharacterized protein yjeF
MSELLTAAQMRAIEQAAIASGQVTGLELMERAGQGVVQAIFDEWPELATTPHRAVVLCGPGNNGGDGFVVARLLKGLGWEVEVYLYGDPEKLPPDARVNYMRWVGVGEVAPAAAFHLGPDGRHTEPAARPPADVFVDALFGTGLARPVPDDAVGIFSTIFVSEWWVSRIVAVDIPSGLCADSGCPIVPRGYPRMSWPFADGLALQAQLTVTFHRGKVGQMLDRGPQYCGKVVVKDIGLKSPHDPKVLENIRLRAGHVGANLHKNRWAHKYDSGHALILSGLPGQGGAARLSARGALRIGAGVVTVACPPEALAENSARLDAIMLRSVADAEGLADVLQDARINALCLGPGLGLGAREAEFVSAALGLSIPPPPSPPHKGEGSRPERTIGDGPANKALPLPLVGRGEGRGAARRPTVLDADALTLLSRDPALFAALHKTCILTPHAGEFARLFPDIAEKLAAPATQGPAYSKVDATREAAARAGCVVLYKGPDTVIADPTGRCAINAAVYDRAAPWLATAGSGDVLAGFITGLLARGFSPFDAACTGAWLHVECARSFGPGLIAEDLPEELPKVFRSLGL